LGEKSDLIKTDTLVFQLPITGSAACAMLAPNINAAAKIFCFMSYSSQSSNQLRGVCAINQA
jgi:hypothetical protein